MGGGEDQILVEEAPVKYWRKPCRRSCDMAGKGRYTQVDGGGISPQATNYIAALEKDMLRSVPQLTLHTIAGDSLAVGGEHLPEDRRFCRHVALYYEAGRLVGSRARLGYTADSLTVLMTATNKVVEKTDDERKSFSSLKKKAYFFVNGVWKNAKA
jgi:hypothetical protein